MLVPRCIEIWIYMLPITYYADFLNQTCSIAGLPVPKEACGLRAHWTHTGYNVWTALTSMGQCGQRATQQAKKKTKQNKTTYIYIYIHRSHWPFKSGSKLRNRRAQYVFLFGCSVLSYFCLCKNTFGRSENSPNPPPPIKLPQNINQRNMTAFSNGQLTSARTAAIIAMVWQSIPGNTLMHTW